MCISVLFDAINWGIRILGYPKTQFVNYLHYSICQFSAGSQWNDTFIIRNLEVNGVH